MKIGVISFKFHWSPIDIQGTTGSDQGITSTCDGLIYWCISYKSMRGLGELMQYFLNPATLRSRYRPNLGHFSLKLGLRVLTNYTPELTRYGEVNLRVVIGDESNEIHIFHRRFGVLSDIYVRRAPRSGLSPAPIRHFPKTFPVASARRPHGFVASAWLLHCFRLAS